MTEAGPRHGRVRGNGLHLHYVEWGEPGNRTVLLLHGFASSTWSSWRALGQRLGERFHVVGLDLRGHGESDRDPAARYTLRDYAGDIETALPALGQPPQTVIGHSMGGRLALLYAARHHETLERLVLVDSKVEGGRSRPDMIASYPERFATVAEADAFAERIYGRRKHRFEYEFVRNADGTVDWRFDLVGQRRSRSGPDPVLDEGQWAQFGALRTPTLVVRSGRSGAILPADVVRMHELNPATRTVEYESAGHLLHLDEPERFWSDVTSFLTADQS